METAAAVKAATVKAGMEHAGPMGQAMVKPAMVENREPKTNRVAVITIVVRVTVIIGARLVILIIP